MKCAIIATDPLLAGNFANERNTDCISERAKYPAGGGDKRELCIFMNSPG